MVGTPRTDAAISEAHFEADEALSRILAVMVSQYCRDSLTELLAMDFNTFFHLEMHVVHATFREEERAYNKYQMQKPR